MLFEPDAQQFRFYRILIEEIAGRTVLNELSLINSKEIVYAEENVQAGNRKFAQ